MKGQADPIQIAQFAKRAAKKKIPQIIAALEEHQMSNHHRLMIRFNLDHLRFLEDQIYQLDEEISKKIREAGHGKHWGLLQSLPAVGDTNAATILAEMGPDPQNFASKKHLSSWAGLCPRNNRSAGKDNGSHTTEGNRWLRGALTESAWAIAAKKDGHVRNKFWRIADKSRPKAVVAIAHDLLVLAYIVLQRGIPTKRSAAPQ